MSRSSIDSLKIKAKLLQKAKKKRNINISLRQAFSVIAKTAGYVSWKEMKDAYEIADLLNPPRWSSMWKIWFSSKKEALRHLKGSEKYLLPYLDQFFICDADYISALGVPPNDKDVLAVGNDWSNPSDQYAWRRLINKMKAHSTN
jgi:hypothetical protein